MCRICYNKVNDDRGKFSCEPANPIKKLSPFFIDLRRMGVVNARVFSAPFRFSLRKEIQ